MSKRVEFLLRQGDGAANEVFLAEVRQSILLELEKEGFLEREQVQKCLDFLKKEHK